MGVVEASKVPTHGTREGKLKLTGQLGSVMRESAELALSWIRSHAKLPAANTRDLQSLPDNVKDAITFIPAGTLEEVLTAAFTGGLNLTPPTPSIEHSKL